MGKYDDIINLQRPISKNHRPMPVENRAAQFAPFAALTGYDDAVEETARLTDRRIELSEEMKQDLDNILMEIRNTHSPDKNVRVTYFVPDLLKEGGEYVTEDVIIKKVDDLSRQIILSDKRIIKIDDILRMEIIEIN